MKVGILGATGAVGQKFIRLLQAHPWFSITKLGASERSAGKSYKEAVNWIEDIHLPENIAAMSVNNCVPEEFSDVDFVFSGLDSSVAGHIEKAFAVAGIPVISNAKNYRQHKNVPLMVPEVNPEHTALIKQQDFDAAGKGWIVTNPNCVAVPLALSLKPLHDVYGVESIILTTMQAISGAGYPGVASLDILGNVIPNISGEEPKIRPEIQKLLGVFSGEEIKQAHIHVDATTTRVPALNGHTLAVSVKFKTPPQDLDEVKSLYRNWKNPIAELALPSSPARVIEVHEHDFHPQPRLHAEQQHGMQLHIGRLRQGEVFDLSFVAMAHNTIRGAAGGAILNAELLVKKAILG